MPPKIGYSISAFLVVMVSLGFYFKDMLKSSTKPHLFTWFIWTITSIIAAAGVWHGKGGFIKFNYTASAFLVFLMFCSCFKWGTKNITSLDILTLVFALSAIAVWGMLNNLKIAVAIASGIDVIGYVPTYGKCYKNPWSETLITWCGFTLSATLAICGLENYNFLTMTYGLSIISANLILIALCLIRRRAITQPSLAKAQAL